MQFPLAALLPFFYLWAVVNGVQAGTAAGPSAKDARTHSGGGVKRGEHAVGVHVASSTPTAASYRSVEALFPGDAVVRSWPSLFVPNITSPDTSIVNIQQRVATTLKARYAHVLRTYASIRASTEDFERVVGSFSFLEPLTILSVVAASENRLLKLSELCVVDIGGGAQVPEFLEPFLGSSRYLAFDAEKSSVGDVASLMTKHPGYTIINAITTPPTLAALFAEHSVPREIAVLKIDIDSCDCDILSAALAVTSPSVIVMEVNPSFPPPIRFNLAYKPHMFHNNRGPRSPIFGCSLAFATELVQRSGYTLLQSPIEDAYFVKRDVFHLFGNVPRTPAAIYAMGNPLLYSYRKFGPGVLREWQRWQQEHHHQPRNAGATDETLLSLVQSNITALLTRTKDPLPGSIRMLAAQVQLS